MRKLFIILSLIAMAFAFSPSADAQQALCRAPNGQLVRCPPRQIMPRPPMYRMPMYRPVRYYQPRRQYYAPAVVASAIAAGAYSVQRYSSYGRNSVTSTGTTKWGSGKDLFKVAGTPQGYAFDGVSDPNKAALCVPPRRLYKTDECRRVATGQIECKNGCE